MSNDTCRAVAFLCDRMDPAKFFYCFAEHLLNCRSCRSFLDGPKLTEMASRFVFGLGNLPDDMLPPPSVYCQQVEYLSMAAEEVDQRSFSRSFGAHILSCPRCLRLVPSRISPELLVPKADSAQVRLAL